MVQTKSNGSDPNLGLKGIGMSPAEQTSDVALSKHASDPIVTPVDKEKTPIVFVSYSHDNKDHKAWVASFARKLMDHAVDVLFDQWDMGPGDDVTKFMEQAVARADRVLMICTESYVRKADDGKGGVGYETMVVTGELVRNLGTDKFIPVIRQTNSPKALPRCVSTRFYVDLSDDAEIEDNFEVLLREIHNAPKLSKPPLGKNPFAAPTLEGTATKAAKQERQMEFSESLNTPEAAYERALEIIHADNRVTWRKFLLAANEHGAEALKRWRSEKPEIPPVDNKDYCLRFAHVQSGLKAYEPFIACLIAAAETGKLGYADQLGWVESLLDPLGYEKSGTVYHAAFPQIVFFVTQALVGGMLMLSGTGDAAYQLAITKIPDSFNSQKARPLFSMTRCNGWPDTLEHTCTVAWQFLISIVSSWEWLKKAYGNEHECRSAIGGYYQLLSFLNFLKLKKDDKLEAALEPQFGTFPVTVPASFCVGPERTIVNGYKLFLNQSQLLVRLLEANQINVVEFETAWNKWMQVFGRWLGEVYVGYWPEMHVPQRALPKDLKSNEYVLD